MAFINNSTGVLKEQSCPQQTGVQVSHAQITLTPPCATSKEGIFAVGELQYVIIADVEAARNMNIN